MTDLEDALRRQLAALPDPALTPQPGLARTLRRRAHRRSVTLTASTGAVALVAVGATATALRHEPRRASEVIVGAPPTGSTSPSPSARPCSVPELLAQGGPKSMADFEWPSGATLVLLTAPAENCPIDLMLSSAQLAPEDVAAAEQRWGANVHLLAYDAARLQAEQSLPTASP